LKRKSANRNHYNQGTDPIPKEGDFLHLKPGDQLDFIIESDCMRGTTYPKAFMGQGYVAVTSEKKQFKDRVQRKKEAFSLEVLRMDAMKGQI